MGSSSPNPYEVLKAEGNSIFREASVDVGLDLITFKSRMQEALKAYFKAQEYAKTYKEESSILKNLGLVHMKIGNKYEEITKEKETDKTNLVDNAIFQWCESLNLFQKAILWGQKEGAQNQDWISNVNTKVSFCVEKIWDMSTEQHQDDFSIQNGYLHKLCLRFNGKMRSLFFMKLASLVFSKAMQFSEEGNVKNSLRLLQDNNFNIEEAKRHLVDNLELQNLEKSNYDQLCICESVLFRRRGDKVLEVALQDNSEPDMDKVWDVVDLYLQAIGGTRDKCLESEAIAHTRLGKLYEKLSMNAKSRSHYKYAIDLVEALKQTSLKNNQWYKDALGGLRKFQLLDQANEAREWQQSKAPILKELMPQLTELKRAFENSADRFVDYIYSHHPPKIGHPPTSSENTKKKLRIALLHYHPDKQSKENLKDFIICEEITMLLNRKYECFKD